MHHGLREMDAPVPEVDHHGQRAFLQFYIGLLVFSFRFLWLAKICTASSSFRMVCKIKLNKNVINAMRLRLL